MKYKRFEDDIYVRMDDGDDIRASLEELCKKEQIALAAIQGFGGIRSITVGIWNNEQGGYDYMNADHHSMEALSIVGNVTMKDGEPMIHTHVTVSDNEFHVFGGHLVKGVIQNMAEFTVHIGKGVVNRIPVNAWAFMDL